MEWWKDGRMKGWKDGGVGGWVDGWMHCRTACFVAPFPSCLHLSDRPCIPLSMGPSLTFPACHFHGRFWPYRSLKLGSTGRNVLIDKHGTVKLSDFGSSRHLSCPHPFFPHPYPPSSPCQLSLSNSLSNLPTALLLPRPTWFNPPTPPNAHIILTQARRQACWSGRGCDSRQRIRARGRWETGRGRGCGERLRADGPAEPGVRARGREDERVRGREGERVRE
eukprot:1234766-Rhodomonas_salina.3